MTIAAWMKHPVATVKPRDSAQHAREAMEKHRISQMPVVTDGHLVGIPTDRDLRDAFPSVLESAPPFRRQRARHGTDPALIPVVEGKRLVGILTRSDVLDAFVE